MSEPSKTSDDAVLLEVMRRLIDDYMNDRQPVGWGYLSADKGDLVFDLRIELAPHEVEVFERLLRRDPL